jgi:uncharacterized protein YcbK (DUF882 family)
MSTIPAISSAQPPSFNSAVPAVSHMARRGLLGGLITAMACLPSFASAGAVRRLTLVRPATGEALRDVPFWWDGAPYEPGLAELDWLMRDVQAKRVRPIDVRVFYLLAMVQAEFDGRPILVTSGFRTRATNERLRAQGIDAARNSFHLRGQAVDIQIPGVAPASMAELGSLLGLGGVGVYAGFVHLDTGPKRMWKG